MARNVLIVAQNFPPLDAVSAHRFGSLAPRLEAGGWRPWIVTACSTGSAPVRLDATQIIRVGDRRDPTVSRSGRNRVGNSPARRWLRDVVKTAYRKSGLCPFSVDRSIGTWYRKVAGQESAVLRQLPRIDLVIASFGPAAGLWLGRRLAKRLQSPWIADFRDLGALRDDRSSASGQFSRFALTRYFDRMLERRSVRTASGFTTVSPTLADILRENYCRPTAVIYNGWDPLLDRHFEPGSETQEAVSEEIAKRTSGMPYLHYAGLFYPHRTRSLLTVLKSLSTQPGVHLVLRSLGPTTSDREIIRSANRLGVQQRVHLLPRAEPAVIRAEADGALANLVLEDLDQSDLWSRGWLTGKLLKLIALGPPVLSVARSDSDIGPILARTNKGALCSTMQEVGIFIRSLSTNPACYRGESEEIANYSTIHQASVLCRFFDQVATKSENKRLVLHQGTVQRSREGRYVDSAVG